jgi:hypothetical protein
MDFDRAEKAPHGDGKSGAVDQYVSPSIMLTIRYGEGCTAMNCFSHVGVDHDDVVTFFGKRSIIYMCGMVSLFKDYKIKPCLL